MRNNENNRVYIDQMQQKIETDFTCQKEELKL